MTDEPQPTPKPRSALDKPMTRRGCVLGVAAWAVVMALPVCIFALAIRGELGWQRGPFTSDRLWIVRADPRNGQPESGLAYESVRVSSGRANAQGPVCARTRVYFRFWDGASETLDFCECYAPGANGAYDPTGSCQP
jgi:hypothetical protein